MNNKDKNEETFMHQTSTRSGPIKFFSNKIITK